MYTPLWTKDKLFNLVYYSMIKDFFYPDAGKKFKGRTQVKLEFKLSINSFTIYFWKWEFLRQ